MVGPHALIFGKIKPLEISRYLLSEGTHILLICQYIYVLNMTCMQCSLKVIKAQNFNLSKLMYDHYFGNIFRRLLL